MHFDIGVIIPWAAAIFRILQQLLVFSCDQTSSIDAQKSKHKKRERERLTIYLDPEVNTWILHRIADTREEISDVVNDAVRRLMQKVDK